MVVADSSGEIQVSTFDAVDELFARVKKGKAVQVHPLLHDPAPTLHSTLHSLYTRFMLSTLQIPLTASTIKAKDAKWNQTTHQVRRTTPVGPHDGTPSKHMASTHVYLASTHVHQFEVILKEVSTRGVCMLDDDSKLPQHSYDFASIADVPSHPVGTNFHALGVVVDAGDVEHELTKSGTQGSQRTLTIADESLRSIPLRITSQRVEHIGGSVGSIVAVKGLTGAYFGTPKLSAFVDNVDIDPDITEAQKLRERWQHVRMEQIRALLPAFDFTPIASLATEADAKSAVDLLAIVVSAEPPPHWHCVPCREGAAAREHGGVRRERRRASVHLLVPRRGHLTGVGSRHATGDLRSDGEGLQW